MIELCTQDAMAGACMIALFLLSSIVLMLTGLGMVNLFEWLARRQARGSVRARAIRRGYHA